PAPGTLRALTPPASARSLAADVVERAVYGATRARRDPGGPQRRGSRDVRPAWICLPPAMLAALVGAIVTPVEARAYSYMPHAWGECVTLMLTDGRKVTGTWRGAFGTPGETTGYESRYETWRGPGGRCAAPALGESLRVSRTQGGTVIGAFRGFAGPAMLLSTADSCAHLMVTLAEIEDVRRAADPATEPEWTAARERWSTAP